jgi:hypothetical protein
MKDKVKALRLLDNFQEINEKEYYMFIFGDNELWDLYLDVVIKWTDINSSMTEKELDRYGDSLPDEMDDKDWTKKQGELLCRRIKEARSQFFKCL